MNDKQLNDWFVAAVLPLEPQLLAYFARHWRAQGEIQDMVHDVYERALIGARRILPVQTKAYVFTIARNLLIDRVRRKQVVSFDLFSDLGAPAHEPDDLTPERHASGRDELRRVIEALDLLPPRCREVVRLRKLEGLSTKDAALRLGVGIDAVERQMTLGMRALTNFLLGANSGSYIAKGGSAERGPRRRD